MLHDPNLKPQDPVLVLKLGLRFEQQANECGGDLFLLAKRGINPMSVQLILHQDSILISNPKTTAT